MVERLQQHNNLHERNLWQSAVISATTLPEFTLLQMKKRSWVKAYTWFWLRLSSTVCRADISLGSCVIEFWDKSTESSCCRGRISTGNDLKWFLDRFSVLRLVRFENERGRLASELSTRLITSSFLSWPKSSGKDPEIDFVQNFLSLLLSEQSFFYCD